MGTSYRGIFFAIVALSLCVTPAAYPRSMRIITYDELFDKSDLVVIAEPASKTTDTNEKTFFSAMISMDASGTKSRVPAIGVETPFNVDKVIKGDARIKQFVLHHYRDASSGSGITLGGALIVSFDPSDPKRRRDILLFLVREKDGRYAPYGGQTDPSDQSIFALEDPPR